MNVALNRQLMRWRVNVQQSQKRNRTITREFGSVKTISIWILLVTLLSCSASITAQRNPEDFYVTENIPKRNGLSRELTCVSKDDDAALIWNYDLNSNRVYDHFKNFKPVKPTPTNIYECAIWESKRCLVSWKSKNTWNLTSSVYDPMGPVTDYRWEDFEEIILNHVDGRNGSYQNVRWRANIPNGTLVFSIRGTRDIEIQLCGNKYTMQCFLVEIADLGRYSVIKSCFVNVTKNYGRRIRQQICQNITSVEHKTKILDAYEWRTFRLQWINNIKKIKLFNDTENEAFLEGHVQEWHSVNKIWVKSDAASRIKFHFYEYFLATKENAVLYTEFIQRKKNFCIKMLVSLCPECELYVSLTDSVNGHAIANECIHGDERSHLSGLRTWQSMKLSMSLNNSFSTSLKFQITSILKNDIRKDIWWAIDHIRDCGEINGVRKSTITIPISDPNNGAPRIKCQKLFHKKIVVDGPAMSKTSDIPSRLRRTMEDCIDIVRGIRNITLIRNPDSTKCRKDEEYALVVYNNSHHKLSEYCIEFPCTLSYDWQPCTEYEVRVVSVNGSRNITKKIGEIRESDFTSRNKLSVNMPTDKLIKLTVPAVVNWTENTMVVVTVKGYSLCEKISFENLSVSINETESINEWIAAQYQVNHSEPVHFTFDISKYYGVERNCSFQAHESYKFVVELKNRCTSKTVSVESSTFFFIEIQQSEERIIIITWPVLVITLTIIVMTFLLSGFIWYRRYKRARIQLRDSEQFSLVPITRSRRSYFRTSKRSTPLPNNQAINDQENESDSGSYDFHHNSVKLEELEEYIKEALSSGSLQSEWQMLPGGFLHPCKYGYLSENRLKNQCNYIVPYDNNRVILTKIPNEPYSDYVNASYIRGYKKAKAYIATQGPKQNDKTKTDTVPDFWRMIWQEKVRVICMLTNVIEDGRRKCEKYWPDVGKSVEYGDAYILNIGHEVFADYTIRTLQLICHGTRQEIKHFHYTGWPDHKVPMFVQSLAAFLKKLQATPIGNGPMVVHGCASIGRTGTLILCDICLRQAIENRVINIPSITLKLRQDRANMVENMQQYLLAYLVIAECKILERTQIHCSDQLKEKINELRKELPSDIQRLKTIVWQDRALHSLIRQPIVADKLVLPLTFGRKPHGRNPFDAVIVGSSTRKKHYMAIKLPSPSKLPEFWSFIAEKKIELIVILQRCDAKDATHCDIITDDPSFSELSHVHIARESTLTEKEYFTTEQVLLTDILQKEAKSETVTILTCKKWKMGLKSGILPSVKALVSLWMESEKIQRKKSPTLVICGDGITGCGLYLALSFLLERMSLERVCDVISAVRAVRRSKPEFVQSLNEFEYLYDAAISYYETFKTYANFS